MMDQSKALAALAALANETRLNLVRMLVRVAPDALAQGEIARRLSVTASGLAFHLSLLEQADLVTARREGRSVLYAANTRSLGGVLGYVLHDCCAAHPEVRDCCAARPLAAKGGT